MTTVQDDTSSDSPIKSPLSAAETFLLAVESRTDNASHQRLLRACRSETPTEAMEEEVTRIVEEILDEA